MLLGVKRKIRASLLENQVMIKSIKKLNWIRSRQRDVLETTGRAIDAVGKVAGRGREVLVDLDCKIHITEAVKAVSKKTIESSILLDNRYQISPRASAVAVSLKDAGVTVLNAGKHIAEIAGAINLIGQIKVKTHASIIEPSQKLLKETGVSRAFDSVGHLIEVTYGKTREVIKPYFTSEDPHELLKKTRAELAHISSCIMQINSSESEKLADQFGKAIVSKISGVAASGALLSLVATFGTSGTGTAIAALSGAASTSATLAWVGSLVGGGMVAGAALTGGVSLVLGLAAYQLLGSERRTFESLSEAEQRIVQSSWLVMAIITDYLKSAPELFTQMEAELLLSKFFRPLFTELTANTETICENLDKRHAVIFRQHVLVDFRRVVIDGFERFIEGYPLKGFYNAEYVIGGVLYGLLTQTAINGDMESQLVLDALRRSTGALSHATESQLGNYLRELSPEGLKGVGSNVKGIYHELLFTHNYNDSHVDSYAEMFAETNHPGADIQIRDAQTHAVVKEYQLKAVEGTEPLYTHFQKYPDISVGVTDEVAQKFSDSQVESSGFKNEVLKARVQGDLDSVVDNSLNDRAWDSFLLAAGVASSRELFEMVKGDREFPDAVANACKAAGVSSASTLMTAYLFG